MTAERSHNAPQVRQDRAPVASMHRPAQRVCSIAQAQNALFPAVPAVSLGLRPPDVGRLRFVAVVGAGLLSALFIALLA
ncbi:MAG: hypothetical protein KDK29_05905 [Sedimentitalea sp.]|nr:hypothetical protein [Sedimentitalea sp.]